MTDFIFLGSKVIVDGDCSHEIKRLLLLGRKAMTNLALVCTALLQSCQTLGSPTDHSLPGSSDHGIFQARILEWISCPNRGDLPDSGIKPTSFMYPTLAGRFFTTSDTWSIKEQRHHFAEKGPYSQNYDFSSSSVWM